MLSLWVIWESWYLGVGPDTAFAEGDGLNFQAMVHIFNVETRLPARVRRKLDSGET
jgi:hypothetical protein